ncbi:hypothetical protein HK101_007270 [Irineochytrium annulatum]|nr:hypothetical protein HK101_007270 [Irineochytrium annulatum]
MARVGCRVSSLSFEVDCRGEGKDHKDGDLAEMLGDLLRRSGGRNENNVVLEALGFACPYEITLGPRDIEAFTNCLVAHARTLRSLKLLPAGFSSAGMTRRVVESVSHLTSLTISYNDFPREEMVDYELLSGVLTASRATLVDLNMAPMLIEQLRSLPLSQLKALKSLYLYVRCLHEGIEEIPIDAMVSINRLHFRARCWRSSEAVTALMNMVNRLQNLRELAISFEKLIRREFEGDAGKEVVVPVRLGGLWKMYLDWGPGLSPTALVRVADWEDIRVKGLALLEDCF